MNPIQDVLLYIVMPLWFCAGLADWLCHRASGIAHTTGPKESLIHLLMYAEIGVPLLACLFFEINALIIGLMIVAFLAHQATAFWDVRYAVRHRVVTPIEQHVHSFLEMMPLLATILVALLHWPQALALFGMGPEPARFDLVWQGPALPLPYIAALLGAAFFLELLPYLEELGRGLVATGGRLVPRRR